MSLSFSGNTSDQTTFPLFKYYYSTLRICSLTVVFLGTFSCLMMFHVQRRKFDYFSFAEKSPGVKFFWQHFEQRVVRTAIIHRHSTSSVGEIHHWKGRDANYPTLSASIDHNTWAWQHHLPSKSTCVAKKPISSHITPWTLMISQDLVCKDAHSHPVLTFPTLKGPYYVYWQARVQGSHMLCYSSKKTLKESRFFLLLQ